MTDKILEVRGLTKTYGGVKKRGAKKADPTLDVLKGIDLDIYRGDVVCLIGPSGCGKSTFLRCLNRLETPSSGSIKFEGVEVDEAHIDPVRQKMGMVFQHFNLFPHLTVKKNLELAPSLLKLKDKEAISARADELLARVGLADKANVYPKSLSGGQQQRIAIARALAMDPDVILWDSGTLWRQTPSFCNIPSPTSAMQFPAGWMPKPSPRTARTPCSRHPQTAETGCTC